MWKFKASKYKNASPKFLKKEEVLSEIPVGSVMPSCGNHVAASCTHMAFSIESGGGGNIAILPIDARGRQGGRVPVIQAHSDYVTDFQFSPFDDQLLMSASQDLSVRLWRLPDGALPENLSNSEMTLTQEERRVENLLWHPTAENALAASTFKSVKVFDVNTKAAIFSKEIHSDQVQSISWRADGTCFATSGKDKKLKIVDPRANSVVQEAAGHANIKDSRILWLGNRDQVVTTGFDMMRSRELALRDIRNLGSTLRCMNFDTSTGVFMPFFDADTNMLFVGGKGDTCVRFVEIMDKDPHISDGITDTVEQIKGLAMVPKRALDVMQCEVNRLLLLAKTGIIPIPYCVPRKSYNEYHDDLYPDTAGPDAAMTVTEWMQGSNKEVPKVSLNPSKRSQTRVVKKTPAASSSSSSSSSSAATTAATSGSLKTSPTTAPKPSVSPKPKRAEPRAEPTPEPQNEIERVRAAMGRSNISNGEEPAPSPSSVKKSNVLAGLHQSKCRHLQGAILSQQLHITNVRNVSTSIPGESDFFHANKERCALPIGGAGGLIAVLELSNAGKLPDTGVPVVQNGALLMDFEWDPFDNYRLAAACDDAKIRVWDLPIEGLTETLTEPDIILRGHTEKIYFIRFHPLAKDVLASASYDMTIRLWDLATQEEQIQLSGHTDTIFCLAWSMDGKKLATVCKDGKVRIYNPRQSDAPILEGVGPEGSRGARCVWVCDDKLLAVCGFDKMTHRQISIYDATKLKTPLKEVELDVSPSILIPHYDADTSTLFVTGRGDGVVHAFEITKEAPHFYQLSSFKGDGLHQAVSFLSKIECDVKKVEFAKGWRLTMHTVEPVSFTIPRIKTEYFQDDLFPDTKVTWNPTMNSSEWFSGANQPTKTVSLRPPGMKLLSDAPVVAPKPKKYESYNPETYKTDEQKKEELLSAISGKLDLSNEPLPQDLTEGVDDDEWDD